MAQITRKAALQALAESVKERGAKYVYRRDGGACFYERQDTPSCGVGLALNKLGVPVTVLRALDVAGSNTLISASSVQLALSRAGYSLNAPALRVFRRFQQDQDSRVPWGICLARARKAKASDV